MTRDAIAITISAFLFFAWLFLWAAWRMLRPRARKGYVLRWDDDGIEQGDKGLGNDWQ